MLSDFVFHSMNNLPANKQLLQCFKRIGLHGKNRELLKEGGWDALNFIFQNEDRMRKDRRKLRNLVPTPKPTNLDPRCAVCDASNDEVKLKSCAKCESVLYCSRECQKKDWKKHKRNCKKLL